MIGLLALCAVALFAIAPAVYSFISYYDGLQQEVIERFSGKRWTIPSRIYSDSVTIYPGQRLSDIGFFERIARLNYHQVETPAEVNARGTYFYDQKHGRLLIFLHSFPLSLQGIHGRAGAAQARPRRHLIAIDDGGSHEPVFSIELEPELLGAIFQGDWDNGGWCR